MCPLIEKTIVSKSTGLKNKSGCRSNSKLVSILSEMSLLTQITKVESGQLLIFGSYLAHRSGPNNSDSDRNAIYATYNCKSEGDLHDEYYADRAKLWPPTHKRQAGENYDEGAMRYGFGSPMLSVDLGKQYVV
jgi:Phytanoyl-CoA dioxygenase (PhyH)